MKKNNAINANKLYLGLNFGDHEVNPKTIIEEIKKETKNRANVFLLRSKTANPLSDETYIALAEFAKKENMKFGILTHISIRLRASEAI